MMVLVYTFIHVLIILCKLWFHIISSLFSFANYSYIPASPQKRSRDFSQEWKLITKRAGEALYAPESYIKKHILNGNFYYFNCTSFMFTKLYSFFFWGNIRRIIKNFLSINIHASLFGRLTIHWGGFKNYCIKRIINVYIV